MGVEKQVPTLEGEFQTLKVPEGTQPGAEFRIRAKGVPHLRSDRRGDLRVVVDLQVPRSLNAKQRKLLEELSRSFGSPNGVDHAPMTLKTKRTTTRVCSAVSKMRWVRSLHIRLGHMYRQRKSSGSRCRSASGCQWSFAGLAAPNSLWVQAMTLRGST